MSESSSYYLRLAGSLSDAQIEYLYQAVYRHGPNAIIYNLCSYYYLQTYFAGVVFGGAGETERIRERCSAKKQAEMVLAGCWVVHFSSCRPLVYLSGGFEQYLRGEVYQFACNPVEYANREELNFWPFQTGRNPNIERIRKQYLIYTDSSTLSAGGRVFDPYVDRLCDGYLTNPWMQ